jgi:hypothetical protein
MEPIFIEIQRFEKWWLFVLLPLPFFIFLVPNLLSYIGAVESSTSNSTYIDVLIPFIVLVLIMSWILMMRLKTNINSKGVTAHFQNMPFCKRHYNWSDIESIIIIEYSPLWEYGGWGVRLGANGWCYNVSGNYGIKIIDKTGKPFLIGTQKKEAAEEIINHYLNK